MCLFPRLVSYKERRDGSKYLDFKNKGVYFSDLEGHFDFFKFKKMRDQMRSSPIEDGSGHTETLIDILTIPCGFCVECLKQRSEAFATRVACEYQSIKERSSRPFSSFLTLTIDDLHLVRDTISRRDLQLFFKRLRKKYDFKYFACGEYGDHTFRPHYHAIILGEDISQADFSSDVARCWPFGMVNIQFDIGFKAMAYVARYCDKKIESGMTKKDFENAGFVPPFVLLSQHMGLDYFLNHKKDILDLRYIQLADGQRVPVPVYFLKYLEPEELESWKDESRILTDNALSKDIQLARVSEITYFNLLKNRGYSLANKKKGLVRSYE